VAALRVFKDFVNFNFTKILKNHSHRYPSSSPPKRKVQNRMQILKRLLFPLSIALCGKQLFSTFAAYLERFKIRR
jgi:hypothetical protein